MFADLDSEDDEDVFLTTISEPGHLLFRDNVVKDNHCSILEGGKEPGCDAYEGLGGSRFDQAQNCADKPHPQTAHCKIATANNVGGCQSFFERYCSEDSGKCAKLASLLHPKE